MLACLCYHYPALLLFIKIKHLSDSVSIDLNIEKPSAKDITMTQIIKYLYQASGIKLNI